MSSKTTPSEPAKGAVKGKGKSKSALLALAAAKGKGKGKAKGGKSTASLKTQNPDESPDYNALLEAEMEKSGLYDSDDDEEPPHKVPPRKTKKTPQEISEKTKSETPEEETPEKPASKKKYKKRKTADSFEPAGGEGCEESPKSSGKKPKVDQKNKDRKKKDEKDVDEERDENPDDEETPRTTKEKKKKKKKSYSEEDMEAAIAADSDADYPECPEQRREKKAGTNEIAGTKQLTLDDLKHVVKTARPRMPKQRQSPPRELHQSKLHAWFVEAAEPEKGSEAEKLKGKGKGKVKGSKGKAKGKGKDQGKGKGTAREETKNDEKQEAPDEGEGYCLVFGFVPSHS